MSAGEPTGRLRLGVAVSGGRSVATEQFHCRALKIIRPHYLDDSGQVYYTIVNPGGGYVGGDSYDIEVALAPESAVLLTDQSATKVYRTPGDHVVQDVRFTVGAAAVLEYVPDQLILYEGADFRQRIRVDVDPAGSVFLSDVVTPGWSPSGELFTYKSARLRTEVRVGGSLELVDNLHVVPDRMAIDAGLYLEGRTHVGTVVCFDPGIDGPLVDAARALVAERCGPAGLTAALTTTDRPGFVVRALADRTGELTGLNLALADLVRGRLRGQGAIHLRKY